MSDLEVPAPVAKLIMFMIFDPHPTNVLYEVLGKMDLIEHDTAEGREALAYMQKASDSGAGYNAEMLKEHSALVRSVIMDILEMRKDTKTEGTN